MKFACVKVDLTSDGQATAVNRRSFVLKPSLSDKSRTSPSPHPYPESYIFLVKRFFSGLLRLPLNQSISILTQRLLEILLISILYPFSR